METVTDREGYFDLVVEAGLTGADDPWARGQVEVALPYRGLDDPHPTTMRVLVPGRRTSFGVISDVDDTIMHTGAQRVTRDAAADLHRVGVDPVPDRRGG